MYLALYRFALFSNRIVCVSKTYRFSKNSIEFHLLNGICRFVFFFLLLLFYFIWFYCRALLMRLCWSHFVYSFCPAVAPFVRINGNQTAKNVHIVSFLKTFVSIVLFCFKNQPNRGKAKLVKEFFYSCAGAKM